MEKQRFNAFPEYWKAAIVRFNYPSIGNFDRMMDIFEKEDPYVSTRSLALCDFGERSRLLKIYRYEP